MKTDTYRDFAARIFLSVLGSAVIACGLIASPIVVPSISCGCVYGCAGTCNDNQCTGVCNSPPTSTEAGGR